MTALLTLLISKRGQKKGDRPLYKCRAYPSGSKKHWKAKEEKMRKEEVAANQETFKLLFYRGSEDQRRCFCGTWKGTENRRWYLDLRNDDNRPV